MEWRLLGSLPAEERDRLLANTRRHSYARGEIVVRKGDASDGLHLIESGRLAVRVDTAAGDTAMLNVLGAGDWFGELSLLNGVTPVRTASVVALEAATTRSLSADGFAALRRSHRATGELLLGVLAQRVEQLSGNVVEAMFDGLDLRVFRSLLELADTFADQRLTGPVTIPLTQEQLAELVGGTRPSVNQVLQQLVRDGTIDVGRGRIVVLDPDSLARRVA